MGEQEKKSQNKKQNNKKPSQKDIIADLEKQLEEQKQENLRALAEFENYRRRAEKEKQEIRDKAVIDFVGDLLPAIDNFEMSLKMTDNPDMFIKGVEMIHKNLLETLKEHKFESYEPQLGEEFDPTHHDPHVVETDSGEEGKVLGVIKKGFIKGDKVVRPARVEIKKSQQEEDSEDSESEEDEKKEEE